MDAYAFFFAFLIVGLPFALAGLMALIFDSKILDLPGFLYAAFAAATLATVGMGYVAMGGGRFSITVLFGLHLGIFVPFFFMSLSRIIADIGARVERSKVPLKPFEAALVAERKRELHEAVLLYEDYLDRQPNDEEALRHYAACLVKLSRFDKAVEAHRRAFGLLKGPRQIAAGLEIAYILEAAKGEPEAAKAQIAYLRKRYFNTELEDLLEEKIEELRVRITADPRPFEKKIELAPDPHPHILD